MRTSSAPLRIKVIVLCMLAFSGIGAVNRSASADEVLARKTAPGREVLVRGFAAVDGACKPQPVQIIKVVEAPTHGRVEQRAGVVTLRDAACVGVQLDGVQVFYVPDDGFVGSDRFALDIEETSHRKVHAKVGVDVAAEARSASN